MDNLEFLDSPEGENNDAHLENAEQEAPQQGETAEQAEAKEPDQAEDKPNVERDEKGRFKAKDKDEPVMVPLAALHETRDKLRALEAELMQLRQPQQQEQPQVPDMFEDPQGYTQHIQAQIAAVSLNDRLNLSEEMVRQQAGDEAVNEAQEWGRQMLQNPGFAQIFYSQRNPYGFLVTEYQRQKSLQRLGNDPKEIEAFLKWKEAQASLSQQGNQPAPQNRMTPQRSIASATSAGGHQHTAVGPGVAFSEVFNS